MNRNQFQYVYNHIDFILWKLWDPIGGGTLGIPRDEYSSYTESVVELKSKGASVAEIAKLLNDFETKRMELRGNIGHCAEIATKVLEIPTDQGLRPTDLHYYVDELEERYLEVFSEFGYPTAYYFFDEIDMSNDFGEIRREKLVNIDNYFVHWKELINQGHPQIIFRPRGYWEQAFVICIEYNASNAHSVPVGMTSVMMPEHVGLRQYQPELDFLKQIVIVE